jgi:hypothetical protein
LSLRLEAPDGSAIEEYRIQEGNIEVRRLRSPDDESGGEWHGLTPAELTAHVQRKTAVSEWLRRRLGWRRLLLACTEPDVLRELGYSEAATSQRAA